MRIQHMRSGFTHLKKKAETLDAANIFQMRSIFDGDLLPEPMPSADAPEETVQTWAITSELEEPRWAVVSFERVEAGPLTYTQAAARLEELNQLGIPGLCLITEEAAARMD